MPKITKEQLELQAAKLTEDKNELQLLLDSANENDESMRSNFTRILKGRSGTKKREGYYPELREDITYTWFEIFAEIGKLLVDRDIADLQESIKHMDEGLKTLFEERRKRLDKECDRGCDC